MRGFGLVLVLLAAFCPPPTRAVEFQFSAQPIKIEARPGQLVTRSFVLRLAPEQQPTRFRVRLEDFWKSPDGARSFYRPAGALSRSCASWVDVNPAETVVEGGEQLRVRLSIRVPPEVKPGGYWCALTVDEVPDPDLAPKRVGLVNQASVSTGVWVFVGPLERVARIQEIRLTSEAAFIELVNLGNCPFAVEGRLEFLDPEDGVPVAQVPIARRTVFPEPVAEAILRADLPSVDQLPARRYTVRAVLDIGLDHYVGAQRVLFLKR